MYGGLIMEEGTVDDIFYNPMHPYTKGLLQSLPKKDTKERQRLVPIRGNPPDLSKAIEGCPFAERCPYVMDICKNNSLNIMEKMLIELCAGSKMKGDDNNGK